MIKHRSRSLNAVARLVLGLLYCGQLLFASVDAAFSTLQFRRHTIKSTGRFSSYGRGADIWPPVNEDRIRLEDSFPNGVLPDTPVQPMTTASYTIVDKAPLVLAAVLVLAGMVRPLDALLVSFLTGYFIILVMWARSLRSDGVTPLLPSRPPQGHVPNLVANPLGPAFTTYSINYEIWLKVGALLGLLAPMILLLRYIMTGRIDCATACARPLFFIGCQAFSEAMARRFLTPLPIRILIPLAYNTVRIGYLWNWAFLPLPLGSIGRAIAIGNLTYWMANLFGFLIPMATVRYMRAHFFAVEAEQVNLRNGMEDSAGLMF